MARRTLAAILLLLALSVPGTGEAETGTVDGSDGNVVDETGTVIGTVDESIGDILDAGEDVIDSLLNPPASGDGTNGETDAGGGGGDSVPDSRPLSQAAPLRLTLSARRVQRGSKAVRRGLRLRVRCSRRCGTLIELRAGPRYAKRLRLGTGRRSVRIGFAAVTRSGVVKTRMTSRARSRIAGYLYARPRGSRRAQRLIRRRKVSVGVRALSFDSAGLPSRLRSRRVTLKR